MTNYYISSVAYTAVAQWAATHAYTLGQYVRQLAAPTQGNERVFKCTTAGTSGGTEPAWNKNNNATTTDGTVTWTQVCGQEAEQASANWKAPMANLLVLNNLFFPSGATDTAYVSSDHDYVYTTDPGLNVDIKVVSTNRGVGSIVPPVAADLTVGATEETANGQGYTYNFNKYVFGFTFKPGSAGATAANINLRTRGNWTEHDQCIFWLNNTGATSVMAFQTAETFNGRATFRNCTYHFGATGQKWGIGGGKNVMLGGTLAGSAPSSLIGSGQSDAYLEVHGFDLSTCTALFAAGSIDYMRWGCDFYYCKVPSGEINMQNSQSLGALSNCRFWHCDDSSNVDYHFYEQQMNGIMKSVSNVVKTGGANDGTNGYSLKCLQDPNLGINWWAPMRTPYLINHLTATGTPVTSTVELASVVALDNAKCWLETETLESSSNTLSTLRNTRATNFLTTGSGLTTSSAAWDTGATARQNSHAYVIGDILKVATNSGRVFFCVTAGTSAGSEPGGYASATDGTNVTDGTAHFVALFRYKIASASFTPARKGDIRGQICLAKFSSTATDAVFVDPFMVTA